jgi:hypothetical protein
MMTKNKQFKIFLVPSKSFDVTVKYEMKEKCFVNLPKSYLFQFSIQIDLAPTVHKLQGMMKKNVSFLKYGTAN